MANSHCAPCDVVLSEENVVQPDIFFITKEREHIIGGKNIQGSPDLIVEIFSPYTAKIDRTLKLKLYENFKVKEYWLVDLERKEVELLVLKKKGYQSLGIFGKKQSFESHLLKNLKVDLSKVF